MTKTKQPKEKPFDVAGFCMDYEDGLLDEDAIVAGFQKLVDSGLVWQLQGSYGRAAASLIQHGLVTDTYNVLGGNKGK